MLSPTSETAKSILPRNSYIVKGCYSVLGRQRYLGARPHPGRRQSQTVRGQTYMSPRVLGSRGGREVRRLRDRYTDEVYKCSLCVKGPGTNY